MVKNVIEIIGTILQILLIVIAIAVVFHKENFTIIIYIASFGLVVAILYALNQAPDVAIAEVAIGSAIIPLIYVISISRQREYIILDRINHDRSDLEEQSIRIYELLTEFVQKNDLRINICYDIQGSDEKLTEELNVDLVVVYNDKDKKFDLKGKSSSVLINRLIKHCISHDYIRVVPITDGEMYD
jgi:uncharacterized MnhB-related membrane protein